MNQSPQQQQQQQQRRKFQKFAENLPKIRRKFLKKKVFFEALISYRIEKKTLISYRYRIESKKTYRSSLMSTPLPLSQSEIVGM